MVSLWGSKDNGEERNEDDPATPAEGEESRQQSHHVGGRDPDERTRLLPPRNEGFLSPDDPAVSSMLSDNQDQKHSHLSGISL